MLGTLDPVVFWTCAWVIADTDTIEQPGRSALTV